MLVINPKCAAVNDNGVAYNEFSCLVPSWLESTYFGFEKNYNPVAGLHIMQGVPLVPIVAILLYGLFIVAGQKYFSNREPWNWRKQLAIWNFSLSLFSFIGAARTLPHLFYNLSSLSLKDNLCLDPQATYGSGSTGLWVQLFVLSKFPELIDTLFIVVHKKKLIFLHWYHHVTVLLYCWHSYVTTSPSGIFFVAMNYSVHAIMYGYYFLMAVKCKPKWFNPIIVTVAQISQMFVGVSVTIIAYYYYKVDKVEKSGCQIQRENNVAAFIMYGSYLYLFLQFFVGRYFKVKKIKDAKKKV